MAEIENTLIDTERDALAALLPDNWNKMAQVGVTNSEFTTVATEDYVELKWQMIVRVITRGPSGRHYAWSWKRGLTERDDDDGPDEYGTPKVTEVHATTMTVTNWVDGPAPIPE